MEKALDLASLPAVVAPFELQLVVVFGSRARAQALPGSDLDLGVLHREDRRLGHRELGALGIELSRWSGLQADVVDLCGTDAVFRFEVASEGRPLWQVDPTAWKDFVARALIDHDDVAPLVRACIAAVGRAAREGAPR